MGRGTCKRSRSAEAGAVRFDDQDDVGRADAKIAVVGIVDVIRGIAGADVVAYVRWQADEMTEREIAAQPG